MNHEQEDPLPAVPDLAARLAERRAGGADGAAPAMDQRWSELLFLHWSCDPDRVQATLPPGLTVDTHEGRAWVGLVPFRMSEIRPRGLPALPWLSAFPELNVRTYAVDATGRPGVWFYSLDAARWLAVQVARRGFHLPYHHAAMRVHRDRDSGWIDYRCRRREGEGPGAVFRYRGRGGEAEAEPGSLDFFLLERYLLFAREGRSGAIRRGSVAHPPYRFRAAEVALCETGPVVAAGLPEPAGPPEHAAYVETVAVSLYPLERGR